jgi:hypothetical protein
MDTAATLASPGTTVVIEHARRDAAPERSGNLTLTRAVRSGDSELAIYEWRV